MTLLELAATANTRMARILELTGRPIMSEAEHEEYVALMKVQAEHGRKQMALDDFRGTVRRMQHYAYEPPPQKEKAVVVGKAFVCGCDDLYCPDCHPVRARQEREDEDYQDWRDR